MGFRGAEDIAVKKLLRRYLGAISRIITVVTVWGTLMFSSGMLGQLVSRFGSWGRGRTETRSRIQGRLTAGAGVTFRSRHRTGVGMHGTFFGARWAVLRGWVTSLGRISGRAFAGAIAILRSAAKAAGRLSGRLFSGWVVLTRGVQSSRTGSHGSLAAITEGVTAFQGEGRAGNLATGTLRLFGSEAMTGQTGAMTGASGAMVAVKWRYPVQDGDTLAIYQVMSAVQTGDTLTIT